MVLAGLLSGCFSGHLLDHARRREQVRTWQEAFVDGDDLLVRYAAVDVDDAGRPAGTTERWATIPLAEVRAGDRPVDTLTVGWLSDADARRRREQAVPIQVVHGDTGLIVLDTPEAVPLPPLPAGAFTRLHLEPWVWPLLPFTLAVDAVGTPVLLLFAPAVITVGD